MIRSFCLELGLSNFYSYSECKPYLKAYISHFILYLSFPVVVIVLKWAFGLLIMRLVKFRRHKYMFYQIKWEIVIITLFYFIKTGFIKIFIYRSFHLAGMHIELLSMFQPLLQQVSKIVPSRPDFIHLYHDFDAKWVAHASHKIILIGMVSFNIPILLFFLNNFVTRRCKESKARTMPTQSQMNS